MSNSIFDVWPQMGLWSPILLPFYLFHIWASHKKACVLPPLVPMEKFKLFCNPHLGPNHNKKQSHHSFLCSSHFELAWVLPLLSPESLIMWVINFFIFSWCICGINCLDIWTSFGKGGLILPSARLPQNNEHGFNLIRKCQLSSKIAVPFVFLPATYEGSSCSAALHRH